MGGVRAGELFSNDIIWGRRDMLASTRRRVAHAGWAFVGCLALCGWSALAPAGTVQLTAHAHDLTGELNIPKSVTHPTLAIADTGNVDRPGAHARSWGAAVVTGGVLKKSTGGEGWVVDGNSPKHQYWYANAGTGEFVIPSASPDISTANLRLLILPTGEAVDPAMPAAAPPEVRQYPSQGMFAENDFTVQLKLDSSIVQNGQTTDVFHGSALLGGPNSTSPGLQTLGDFDQFDLFESIAGEGNPGQQRLGIVTPNRFLAPTAVNVLTNTPFTLNLDLIMSQYQIDGFPFEPPLVDTHEVLASSAGDFVVEIYAIDDHGQAVEIRPIVPEPSSLALALGSAVCAVTMWRRGRTTNKN